MYGYFLFFFLVLQGEDNVLGNTGCDPEGSSVVEIDGIGCVVIFVGVIEEVRIVGDSEECCSRTTVPVKLL